MNRLLCLFPPYCPLLVVGLNFVIIPQREKSTVESMSQCAILKHAHILVSFSSCVPSLLHSFILSWYGKVDMVVPPYVDGIKPSLSLRITHLHDPTLACLFYYDNNACSTRCTSTRKIQRRSILRHRRKEALSWQKRDSWSRLVKKEQVPGSVIVSKKYSCKRQKMTSHLLQWIKFVVDQRSY